MQITSTGAVYWRASTGTVAFTDGWNHTALVDHQKISWSGEAVDPPLPVVPLPAPATQHAPSARIQCIESKESGGENVWRDHTPPTHGDKPAGVLQYTQDTFAAHAAQMGHSEWSRWVPWQAEAVGDYDLSLGRRAQWTVPGC